MWQWSATYGIWADFYWHLGSCYVLFSIISLGEIILLESKLHKNMDLSLFCSLLYPQPLEQCLAHGRWSKDIN